MVVGRVGADRCPMVPVVVQGADGREAKISCLLSTGFSEALLLPAAEVTALGLIEATVHPAEVLLGGEAQTVDVLVGGHEPRSGLALFAGCRLRTAFTEGGLIEIEQP